MRSFPARASHGPISTKHFSCRKGTHLIIHPALRCLKEQCLSSSSRRGKQVLQLRAHLVILAIAPRARSSTQTALESCEYNGSTDRYFLELLESGVQPFHAVGTAQEGSAKRDRGMGLCSRRPLARCVDVCVCIVIKASNPPSQTVCNVQST